MRLNSLFYILLLLLFINSANVNSNIEITQAIKQSKVSASILGNEKSTHYHEPIILNISNNTFAELNVSIPAGTLFFPNDEKEQTLIATQNIFAKLSSKQSKKIILKAMCIEPWDMAGDGESVYNAKENTNDTLVQFANFISKNKYFTSCAQSGLWTLIRKNSLSNVYGADTIEQNNIRNYLAKNAGLKILNNSELNDYRYNYYLQPKETLSGYFQFGMQTPHHIQIAMFDTTGILVRELFNQQNFLPKKNEKLAYKFDFEVYTQDKYFVKLIVDNEIVMNRTVNAKAFRDKYKNMLENRN
jgi:hypothetical protein